MTENFKTIPGFSNFMISRHGTVKRKSYIASNGIRRNERTIVPLRINENADCNSRAYPPKGLYVRLGDSAGQFAYRSVAELVWLTFEKPFSPNHHRVCFKDRNPDNHQLSNLHLMPKKQAKAHTQLANRMAIIRASARKNFNHSFDQESNVIT